MIKYIICNLKANKSKQEMIKYEEDLKSLPNSNDLEIVICPSAPYLYLFDKENYKLGAQDISEFDEGSYTGEITGSQLNSMNVKYALIGHSERRRVIKEKQHTITNKIKKAYHNHIKPIYFIGENKEEREQKETKTVLLDQILKAIDDLPDYKRPKIIVVYEPTWAIGTGKLPSKEEIENSIEYIKEILKTKYEINIPVLYGGSINTDNIEEITQIKSLDGIVLGESCKDYNDLNNIIKIVKKYS